MKLGSCFSDLFSYFQGVYPADMSEIKISIRNNERLFSIHTVQMFLPLENSMASDLLVVYCLYSVRLNFSDGFLVNTGFVIVLRKPQFRHCFYKLFLL